MMGTVMPTKIAVLSGSVLILWLQAVSENLSPAVYARTWVLLLQKSDFMFDDI